MREHTFCPEGERRLASYLEGRLRGGERASFEEHARECELCREEIELWRQLAEFPAPRPSAEFAAGFARRLEREVRMPALRDPRVWSGWSGWSGWAAAACLLLSLGFWSGNYAASREAKAEIAEARREMQSMRSLMAVSMLQQQSAVERLRGVSYSGALESADEEVVSALIATLRGDSSVDVRLAAADALRKFAGRPKVRASLADALLYQDSPLLQISLIEMLVDFQEPRAAVAFEALAKTPETDLAVKQRLRQALEEMPDARKIQ